MKHSGRCSDQHMHCLRQLASHLWGAATNNNLGQHACYWGDVVVTANAEVPMESNLQMSHSPSQDRHTNLQPKGNVMCHQDQLQFEGASTLVV